MSKAIDFLVSFLGRVKDLTLSVLWVSLGISLVLIFCLHLRQLNDVYGTLLSQAQDLRLSQIEVLGMGAKVSFDKNTIALQLETENVIDPVKVADVHAAVQNLSSEEFGRIMYVDGLKNLCEFSKSSDKIRRYVEIDRLLALNGLVVISPDLKTYEKQKQEDTPDGRAISCYAMQFTDKGYNVKTALVKTLGRAFDNKLLALK
jgi:hypothetical protein